MIFYIRTSLISFFLLLIFFQTPAQDEKLSVTEWYQNFFDVRRKKSVEVLLKEKSDQWLAAVEIDSDSAKAFVLIEKGLIYLTFNPEPDHHERAMDNFIEALTISDSANFAEGRIFTYLSLARLFQDVNNNEKAFQFLQKAFEYSEKLKTPLVHAVVLKELGRVNAALNNQEEALLNYEAALAYRELEDLPRLEADILFNLASLYETNREYAKALEYHKRSLALRRAVKDRLQEAFLLNEIGEVYQLMNNYERALANFTAALDVYQGIDNKKGIADAYNNIGVLYYDQNNFKQAIGNFQQALTAGKASQSKDPERKSYDYLSLSYKAVGDYKSALESRELFVALNDFMQKDATDQRLLEKQNQSVIVGKETRIVKLESDREKNEREIAEQKRIQFFLYALIGLAAIIALLIFYFYLSKRKSNRQLKAINEKVEAQNIELQNLNATKDKFFSIIGHDLKGPLNSLTSFSNLLINYFDSLSKEEIQTLAQDLDKSLKNLHSLLNNLLEWARSQTGKIEFTPEPFDISTVLQENYELLNTQAATKQITILYENPTPLQVIAHKQSITTVARNLISNSIKFTPPGGAIRLSAIQMNTEVVVSITDNGVGMSEGVIDKLFRIDAKHSTIGTANEKGTGLGLILCKEFVEKNGGRLWVTSEEGRGSVFYFTLPVAS